MSDYVWEIPQVTTATVDDRKRVRIPDAKPGQVLSVEQQADGVWTLTILVKGQRKEKFPRGSLLKYFDKERDEAETAIAKGTVVGPQ